MTKEEALIHGKNQLEVFGGEHKEFILMAIEALEKEPCVDILDKIREEIEKLKNIKAEDYDLEQYCDNFDARIIFRDDVFKIIDKYKAESGDKDGGC